MNIDYFLSSYTCYSVKSCEWIL